MVRPSEGAHLGRRPDVGAKALGGRQIAVVGRVLGSFVAADVTLPEETACAPLAAMQVRLSFLDELAERGFTPRIGEGHREIGQVRIPADAPRGSHEGPGARRAEALVIERVRLRVEHLLRTFVMRIEVRPRHGPRLDARLVDERVLVLANEDVGVDQRPAAESARDEASEVAERPDVVHAVAALARIPERSAELVRRTRKVAWSVGLATFEKADPASRLAQAMSHDRPTEARSDDPRIETLDGFIGHVLVTSRGLVDSGSTSRERMAYMPAGTAGSACPVNCAAPARRATAADSR